METDHKEIQFIEAVFNGDRALGEALKDYGLVIEKPPGTQAELIAKARRWVKAMGAENQWVGSPECGCVKPTIELKMRFAWTATGKGSTVRESVSVVVGHFLLTLSRAAVASSEARSRSGLRPHLINSRKGSSGRLTSA